MTLRSWLKGRPSFERAARFGYRMATPLLGQFRASAIPRFYGFFSDLRRFRRAGGHADFIDLYPCLFDRVAATPFGPHYFYQAVWAFRKIAESRWPNHVDVGSEVTFVGSLTAIKEVEFVDIRPLEVTLQRFRSTAGSVLNMPFGDEEVPSLSSLSVVEHIGLGRYGDPLDPQGTEKALQELRRVLASGGDLLLSLPVGRRRVCFNAHRVYPATEIVAALRPLELVDMAVVDDENRYLTEVDPKRYDDCEFSNGLFHFRKPERAMAKSS